MNEIFIVTKRYYEELEILAVFSTKQKAADFITLIDKNEKDIYISATKFEVDKHSSTISGGYRSYFLRMSKDGNVLQLIAKPELIFDEDVLFDNNLDMCGHVLSKSVINAIEIMNKKREEFLEGNKWPDKKEEVSVI